MSQVSENLQKIRAAMGDATRRAGRAPDEVKLIGICKGQSACAVQEAAASGLQDFGHNYLQELQQHERELGSTFPAVRWHMVGTLQRRKVKSLAEVFLQRDMPFPLIHSLDRIELADTLANLAARHGRRWPCLLQILADHSQNESETRSGCSKENLPALLEALRSMPCLLVEGLMILPPVTQNSQEAAPYFRSLRELAAELEKLSSTWNAPNLTFRSLSMGMTADYETAIAEGATYIRIGTALFGARSHA